MKIELSIPIYASALFEADIDIEGKTDGEILDEFLENMESVSSLCHQCSDIIETDRTIDDSDMEQIEEILKEQLIERYLTE